MTVQDQIALDNHRLNLGLMSKAELMVEYNNDLSLEEAQSKINENSEKKPVIEEVEEEDDNNQI